ncbi:unnamed protein product [Paramecium sonneborni]|uniref:WD40-repeat-containing domain n=1 Tax=Paramecium sonneborni TaxID=65129 RepID=A0A8S1QQL9_9CILI|nr:unnamed protein product [Paramecium sonneborni]
MLESIEELYCSQKHNQPIQMVVFDSKLQRNERLLCSECMDNFDSDARTIGFKKVIQMIEDRKKKNKDQAEVLIMGAIKSVEEFQSELVQLKSTIIQYLNELFRYTTNWIENLNMLGQSQIEKYSFFQELDSLIQMQKGNAQVCKCEELDKVNYSWSQKLLPKFQLFQSFQEFNKCKDCLNNILKEEIAIQTTTMTTTSSQILSQNIISDIQSTGIATGVITNQNVQPQKQEITQIKLKFINDSQQQPGSTPAIAFDSKGQILVTGSRANHDKAIYQIWNFNNGALKLKQSFQLDEASGIIFSKKNPHFITFTTVITSWKHIQPNDWQKSKSVFKPGSGFRPTLLCGELNQDESLFYVGDAMGSIQIWKVEFDQNEVTYLEELQKPQERILSLSLNPSENILVSCSNFIHVWQKGENNQWKFKYVVKPACITQQGNKIKFLSNEQFIWIPKGIDSVCVFELEQGFFQENLDKQIQLTKSNTEDNFQGPIIYNQEKNVIIILRKTHIHIIQKLSNGIFKMQEKMGRNGYINGGALTENGQFLVIWDSEKKAFLNYELLYS